MPFLASRPPLESQTSSDETVAQLETPPIFQEPSRSATLPLERPSTAGNGHGTPLLQAPDRISHNGRASPASGRPNLLRAKSDYGPRRGEEHPDQHDEDSRSSQDGDFRIRHGFESQLTSEEYNNLLNSVSSPPSHLFWDMFTDFPTDIFHVLHRQEA